jgi:nucleoside-diphosphate-sugar epimerase
MTRRPDRAGTLQAMGASVAVADVFDPSALDPAVVEAEPEVVVHQLTALPASIDPRKIGVQFAANDRVRVEGTRNLVAAAVRAGARRIVAQSIAFVYEPTGAAVKVESDPLWTEAPHPFARSVAAVDTLETAVTTTAGIDGVVLRYGYFYGPGTSYAADGQIADMVRRRRFPVVGRGEGVFSFVHVDDAARAVLCALGTDQPGVYNVVDDEPAPVHEWLPAYAAALGAPAPLRVPALVARAVAGRHGVYLMTGQRGASNAEARRSLDWRPGRASWRSGFDLAPR